MRFAYGKASPLRSPFCPKGKAPRWGAFPFGAGNGNRTHLSTLGRSHSTDELYPLITAVV